MATVMVITGNRWSWPYPCNNHVHSKITFLHPDGVKLKPLTAGQRADNCKGNNNNIVSRGHDHNHNHENSQDHDSARPDSSDVTDDGHRADDIVMVVECLPGHDELDSRRSDQILS